MSNETVIDSQGGRAVPRTIDSGSYDSDDLRATQRGVLTFAEELGLVHFPGNLEVCDGKWPVFALWTDDDQWQDFLALAPKAGATVVYTHLDVLSSDDLPREWEAAQAQTASLVDHLNEPFRLTVAYVVGVVVHLWMCEAPWWPSLGDTPVDLVDDLSQAELVG